MVVRSTVFLNSATLICRGTDISKCLKEALGIRDNESRLYLYYMQKCLRTCAKCAHSDLPEHARRLIRALLYQMIVSGQWRPWSDCADAQSDQGLRCSHTPEDTFSHGSAKLYVTSFVSVLNICNLVLDCFFADTNGEKFLWMIAFIVGHQDVQAKCRAEINKVNSVRKRNLWIMKLFHRIVKNCRYNLKILDCEVYITCVSAIIGPSY